MIFSLFTATVCNVLGYGMPHKLPKLLVCGEQDSGKTSWLYVLKGECQSYLLCVKSSSMIFSPIYFQIFLSLINLL